jgi:hypothetical protein
MNQMDLNVARDQSSPSVRVLPPLQAIRVAIGVRGKSIRRQFAYRW